MHLLWLRKSVGCELRLVCYEVEKWPKRFRAGVTSDRVLALAVRSIVGRFCARRKAIPDLGLCKYPVYSTGCMDSRYASYSAQATLQVQEACQQPGCTDSADPNYNPIATYSDGISCSGRRRQLEEQSEQEAASDRRLSDAGLGCMATVGAKNWQRKDSAARKPSNRITDSHAPMGHAL